MRGAQFEKQTEPDVVRGLKWWETGLISPCFMVLCILRQDPLEAVLVNFGRSFLNFSCLKGLGKI